MAMGSARRPGRSRPSPGAALLGALVLAGGAACRSAPPPPPEPVVFFPDPPDPPRIQFLRSIGVDSDVEQGRSSFDRLLFGERELQRAVLAPYGCTLRNGVFYVCDIQQGVVLTLDLAGRKMDYLRLSGRARLQKPVNLAFADDGTLYVADLGRRQIVVLGPDGKQLAEFGPFGENSRPVDVDVAGDRLIVVDSTAARVRTLDRATGEELFSVGGGGPDEPPLKAPTNAAIGSNGEVHVVDTIACRVLTWDREGRFLGTLGSVGDRVGDFARPKGIARLGPLMFVVDAAFENCQVFDELGRTLMFFGGPGTGPGGLYLPAGVWAGTEGLELFADRLDPDFQAEALVVVTSQFGPRKVSFFALGRSSRFQYPEDAEPEAPAAGRTNDS